MLTQGRLADREQQKASNYESETPIVVPSVDIFESEKEVVLEVEMAGATKETIHTAIEGDTLEITGRTAAQDLSKDYTPLYTERQKLQYRRSFVLGAVQKDKIRAQYENGLLRLTLPKVEKPKPKIIAIE
ncbi:MAG TPA: Hsp20/alpha crystallin family protein [Candidatus Eisenbacteria bacterium]|jgi:HSP20 family protein|nr:Hsp20/alpha crystallin family protein [Candidatus Eisenbacteria bacterium]